jgi:HAMP domain-containing protein
VSAVSLKLKYAGAAFLAVVCAALFVIAFLAWQHRSDAQREDALANNFVRQDIGRQLQARAQSTARYVADAVEPALARGEAADLGKRLQRFTDDPSLAAITVRDPAGATLFDWHSPAAASATLEREATEPVRTMIESPPGVAIPKTLGAARVAMAESTSVHSALANHLSDSHQTNFLKATYLAAAVAAVAGLLAAIFGWRAGRRIERPLGALIKSAERIAQGDYTRPLDVLRRDGLGDLQQALERMRGKLRATTINKDYLYSVLQQHDGCGVRHLARRRHQASPIPHPCKLLGYGEEELSAAASSRCSMSASARRSICARRRRRRARPSCAPAQRADDPVAFTGSQIASDDPQFQGNIFVARNITDRKRAERRIRYLARYDALTKIPNRMQFHHLLQQTIARALRGGQVVALLYLDLDRFKEVNDTFGHGCGDRLLEVLAERMTRVLPKDTTCGAPRRAMNLRCSSTACPRMPTTADPSRIWRAPS